MWPCCAQTHNTEVEADVVAMTPGTEPPAIREETDLKSLLESKGQVLEPDVLADTTKPAASPAAPPAPEVEETTAQQDGPEKAPGSNPEAAVDAPLADRDTIEPSACDPLSATEDPSGTIAAAAAAGPAAGAAGKDNEPATAAGTTTSAVANSEPVEDNTVSSGTVTSGNPVEKTERADFTITLKKVCGCARLGLEIDKDKDAKAWRISDINGNGLVARWNGQNPAQQVQKGDLILKVNAVQGSFVNMKEEMGKAQELQLLIRPAAQTA